MKTIRTIAVLLGLWISAVPLAADITTGLVLHHAFEGNKDDSGPNSLIANAVSAGYGAGKIGLALQGGYLWHSANPLFDASSFTIAGWVKINNFGTQQAILSRSSGNYPIGGTGTVNYQLWIDTTGEPKITIGDGTMPVIDFPANAVINANEWVFLAATYSGTMTFYVNGVATNSNIPNKFPAFGGDVYIGSASSSSNFLNGSLDDLRLYDRALTAADIAELYALAPMLSITPDPLDFGSVNVGNSSTSYLTVTNPSGSNVNVFMVAPTGSVDFSVVTGETTCIPTLPAYGSCQVAIEFAPSTASAYNATLELQTSAGIFASSLLGNGTDESLINTEISVTFPVEDYSMPAIAEGKHDLIHFVVPTAQNVALFTAYASDTVGTLYNSSGEVIAENDDFDGDSNFRILVHLAAGNYTLKTEGFSGSAVGAYAVTLANNDDGSYGSGGGSGSAPVAVGNINLLNPEPMDIFGNPPVAAAIAGGKLYAATEDANDLNRLYVSGSISGNPAWTLFYTFEAPWMLVKDMVVVGDYLLVSVLDWDSSPNKLRVRVFDRNNLGDGVIHEWVENDAGSSSNDGRFVLHNSHLLITGGNGGPATLLNVSNPQNIVKLATLNISVGMYANPAYALAYDGNLLAVADSEFNTLTLYDISVPSSVDTLSTVSGLSSHNSFKIAFVGNDRLVVEYSVYDMYEGTNSWLRTYNTSNPANVSVVGSDQLVGMANTPNMAVLGSNLYLGRFDMMNESYSMARYAVGTSALTLTDSYTQPLGGDFWPQTRQVKISEIGGSIYVVAVAMDGLFVYLLPGAATASFSQAFGAGWNLAAVPYDQALTAARLMEKGAYFNAVWVMREGQWHALAGNATLQAVLNGMGIPQIAGIEPGEGFWIQAKSAFSLSYVDAGSYSLLTQNRLTAAGAGWHLLGSGSDITPAQVVSAQPNAQIIWGFKSGQWRVFSPSAATQSHYTDRGVSVLTNIAQGDGLWVKVQ